MPLRCCVIDDEPLASRLIASYIEKTPFMHLVGEYSSPKEAIATILHDNIDVVFLDIQMPQLNGIEFAKIIPPSARIIFTTAYSNYAVDGFRVNALDYLLKPVSYEEFLAAARRALGWHEMIMNAKANDDTSFAEGDYIVIKSEYKLMQININDILYVEGLKDYVKIYLEGNDKSIMTLLNMKTLEHSLPSSMFMRVHRSFIVNLTKISVIERNHIIFGKTQIPISESYKDTFSDYISLHTLG
ncbi:MAG: LytTR family DNA-binding domain-containing protein [Bacteroides sp.]|nr:LytTR family DNA-binding domain-containing protein [Bacteroides sp.]